jgi:FtsH-binding integral membrane protein
MPDNIFEHVPISKLYKEGFVTAATFLGGPLVAGYMIAENFKSLNERQKVGITWIYTILATIVIFGTALFMPGIEKVPTYLIPAIYGGIAGSLVRSLQGEKIKKHLANGGELYSIWRTLLISVIGLIVTVALFLLFGVVSDIGKLFN